MFEEKHTYIYIHMFTTVHMLKILAICLLVMAKRVDQSFTEMIRPRRSAITIKGEVLFGN